MRILLTGAKGQVGQCFRDRLPENWELIAADSLTLDITDAQAVSNMIGHFEPDAVINAAAYTHLKAAEQNRQRAFAVNAQGTRILADAAYRAGIRFVHLSTDYVFDGDSQTPYCETDSPHPLNVYAASKLAGELLALSTNPKSMIVRTSWVFSEYGSNFVRTVLEQSQQSGALNLADDQIGGPTYAGDLAKFLMEILQEPDLPCGIFHFCGQPVSRYRFAQIIRETAAHDFPAPLNAAAEQKSVRRPAYSALSCEKLRRLGYAQPDFQAALTQVIPKILAQTA